MPTGRVFVYEPKQNYRGEPKWPETTIKNWPVQGTGADVMAIIRVDFARRFWKAVKEGTLEGVLVCTVHDSIVVDVPDKYVDKVIQMFYDVFEAMPANFKKIFNVEYNLPIFCEVSVGPNFKELKEIK